MVYFIEYSFYPCLKAGEIGEWQMSEKNITNKRTCIGDGIYLNEIYDPKFKTNNIRIKFITAISEENYAANALLPPVLVTSNSEITSKTELSQKFAGLYGTSVGAIFDSMGDYQVLGFSTTPICDRFTIGGEVISEEVVRQILLCALSPDIKDGKFNEDYFRIRKQELMDIISATVNEKRSYGYMKAKGLTFRNEPAAVAAGITAEKAEKVTQEDLMRQYRYLLKSAHIEITVCGGGGIDNAVEMIKDAFSKLERENTEKIVYRRNSSLKSELENITEKMAVSQSKMYMSYKSDYENIYVCKLFSVLLGNSPFSKLFTNVREKLSLCYYCSAAYLDLKGTLMIDSGVEAKDIEAARKAIGEQVAAVAAGDFTDEELENTKLYMCGAYKSNYDSEWDMASWFEAQNTRGTSYTPEQAAGSINAVTREEIIECAESFKPDSIYILTSEEGLQNG